MHRIGEETSQRLDVIPPQYQVIVTHRPKLACRSCERIVKAPAPERLIKCGLATEAMVASVLVAKYGWNLPLHRQAKMLAAQGLDLDRSTLAFWVGYAAAELTHSHGSEPIHENGKRERAPTLMRGIVDRDESRSARLSITRIARRTGSRLPFAGAL
jgi:transposase